MAEGTALERLLADHYRSSTSHERFTSATNPNCPLLRGWLRATGGSLGISGSHLPMTGPCARNCPRMNCGCTRSSWLLGIDASHIYVLARTAQQTGGTNANSQLLSLLDAHRCGGARRLISCDACVRDELLGPRSRDGSFPSVAEVLSAEDISQHIETQPDDGWGGLLAAVPESGGRTFDEGDRRLAMATDALGVKEDADAWLVSDDEDFLLNLQDSVVQAKLAVFPVASGILMLALYECGAIRAEELEALLQAEQDRVDSDLKMQKRKRAAKQDTLNRIAVRLGLTITP